MPYKNPDRQRRYARYWFKLRRKQWFAANGPCRQCGSWDRLELDHIDRTQKVSHTIWSWSQARRDAELKNCQPLCHTCHLAKTREQLKSTKPCGTRARYLAGCRCEECRRANTDYAAQRRKAVA